MNRIIIYLVLFASIFSQIFASGGSVYTRFGKGDLLGNYFARSVALSGAGNSLGAPGHISLNNPAGLYHIQLTTFETGIDYNGHNISGSDNSILYSKTDFTGFVFAIPIDRDLGIGAAAGIIPITNVNYEIIESITDSPYDNHTFTYSGNGGISKLFISGSYRTPLDIVIGATFNYYTGNIDYTGSIQFESGSDYSDGAYKNRHGHHGLGGTFGVISPDISNIFGSETISNFKIGGYFDFVADLTTDTSITSATEVGSSIVSSGSVDSDYPYTIGVGAGFTLSNDYNIFIDYLFQPWSDYKLGNIPVSNMQDIFKFSAGFEYKRRDVRSDAFWARTILRAGLSYEQSQLKVQDESFNVMAVSVGAGFPLSEGTYIDIGLSYGKRGTKKNNLFTEDILKASFSISFGELWFVREER